MTQLAGVLLYPWMESSPWGRVLLTAFGVLVLGVALRVVGLSPWLTWLAYVLALMIVVLSVISVISPRPELTIATAGMEAAFYFYAAGSLIAYMLQDWVATTDEFFAAGATFTLLAWGLLTYNGVRRSFPAASAHGRSVVPPHVYGATLSQRIRAATGADATSCRYPWRAVVMLESVCGGLVHRAGRFASHQLSASERKERQERREGADVL